MAITDSSSGPDFSTGSLTALDRKHCIIDELLTGDTANQTVPLSFEKLLEDLAHALHRETAEGKSMPPMTTSEYLHRFVGTHGSSYSPKECALIGNMFLCYLTGVPQTVPVRVPGANYSSKVGPNPESDPE